MISISSFAGKVLFTFETKSMKVALEAAAGSGADLRGADLDSSTTLPDYSLVSEKGAAFTGWKKLSDGCIAKLGIPEDAERVSTPIGRKCRANKAIVFAIFKRDGTPVPEGYVGHSMHRHSFTYQVGAVVEAPDYSGDFRQECMPGIHFFITRKEAENY